MPRCRALLVLVVLVGAAVAGCAESDGPGTAEDTFVVGVGATAGRCGLDVAKAPAGPITFEITNDGDEVTTFSFRSEDGEVLGDAGEVGPGETGEVAVEPEAGTYTTVCRAARDAEDLTEEFVVTDD